MYEDISYEDIVNRMLSNVPINVDKREGSLIYNAVAPAAVELKQMYIELDVILQETYAVTASREYLIKRAAERGISPELSTKAILKGVFNIDVPIGSRFTIDNFVFEAIEQITTGEFRMQALNTGSAQNSAIGTIVPTSYIAGLTSAELTEVLIPGEDEEDTEVFRSRYLNSFESQAFGGNVADYIAKTNALDGVGGTKAVRTPAGGGTVGVTIMDSTYGVPSSTLVDDVQTALDPIANGGDGLGIAPIGHVVTVDGVTAFTVNIATTITYADGWDFASLEPYAQQVIDNYFLELRQDWQNQTGLIVRISQIETRLLDLIGVIDIANTQLNGVASNLALGAKEIPERGTLSG